MVRKYTRLNKCTYFKVLIRPQVRSHPALGLTSTGGRYFLGFFYLLGHITRQPQPCGFLSCTLEPPQTSVPICNSSRYFRVLRIARLEPLPKLALNIDYLLLSIQKIIDPLHKGLLTLNKKCRSCQRSSPYRLCTLVPYH